MSFDFDLTGFKNYITEEDLERDGMWFTDFLPGVDLKLRRAGGANRLYGQTVRMLVKPYRKGRRDLDDLPEETNERLMRQIVARAVVADWRGVKDKSGKAIPCTPEAVEELFEKLPELFADVRDIAGNPKTFQTDFIEEVAEELGEG